MALLPITPQAGVFTDGTQYSSKGAWIDSNLIRFQTGILKNIGGWEKLRATALTGSPIGLFAYTTNSGDEVLVVGTREKVYVLYRTDWLDITPSGFVTPASTDPLGYGAYNYNFMNQTGTSLPKNKQVAIDEIWSVHSYEGDYNPIHDHGTKTIMGISTTAWTKVPQQILDQPTAGSPMYSKYNSSGSCDGYLAFNYGRNEIMNVERLRPPQSAEMQPQVGKLLIFPSWLQHMVYPFFGDGERRTVASNLNCWDVEEAA